MARPSTLFKYHLMAFVILGCGIISTADAWWDVNVPGDFANIQAAIDSPAVTDGDTVTILGGTPALPITYTGPGNFNIDFRGKNIIVRTGDSLGNYVAYTCIIDCQKQGRGFIFQSGENASVGARLQGFIIVDGNAADTSWPQPPDVDSSGYGGGIYIKDSSPAIQSCVITDCNADAGGGAIFCDDNASPFITFCDIGQSYSSYNSAGVGYDKYITDANDANSMDVNDVYHLGGGIYCRNSSPWIINCNILWNVSYGSGGGLAFENSNATLRDCDIKDNYCYIDDDRIDQQHGGGIYIRDCNGPGPWISGCSISGNIARWSGGGIAVIDSNALIVSFPGINEIFDNYCGASAGGIYSEGNPHGDPNADPNKPNCIIQNCVITHNWGSWSGGASSNYGSFADIDDCTIAQNIADYSWLVGGLETYGGDANVAGTIIWGNTGIQVASSAGGSAMAMAAGGVEMETAVFGVNPDIDVSYSNIEMFNSQGYYDPTAVWPGEGNINKNPLFISPAQRPYDFHLKADGWNISPSINAGNPFDDYSEEPAPNGNRINMGAYGGTEEAASSDILRPVPSDADADLKVNMVDFAILADNWGLKGENIKNKGADADNNGIVDGRDLAILKKFWLWLQ